MKQSLLITIILIVIMWNTASAEAPKRIVSLSPATTEVLFAMGLGDRIVGVTAFCDYPEAAKAKPKIGGMSNPSLEEIVALKPDMVVMTTDGNPREVDDRLRALGIRTTVWTARTIAELPTGVRELGRMLGETVRAEKLAGEIEAGIRSVARSPVRRKVLFIVWPEPLIVSGPATAIDDAFRLLGLENAAGKAKTSYPRYSIEEVIRQAPELLFVGKGSGMDMRVVSEGILKKLTMIPAVKNGGVCYVGDGLYRLGPRIVEGIREIAQCVR